MKIEIERKETSRHYVVFLIKKKGEDLYLKKSFDSKGLAKLVWSPSLIDAIRYRDKSEIGHFKQSTKSKLRLETRLKNQYAIDIIKDLKESETVSVLKFVDTQMELSLLPESFN